MHFVAAGLTSRQGCSANVAADSHNWAQQVTTMSSNVPLRDNAPDPAAALLLRGVRKTFGPTVAVDGINLNVQPGEFYALLGPNGAGKTTTLRMIAGLLRPDAGQISIFGVDAVRDPIAAKQITAWLPDEPMLYDKLTPLEYLEFVAGLWNVPARLAEKKAAELIDVLELGPHRNTRCEGFSRGMKQKVALAGALIHDPRLIMLDEPLTGIDAGVARQVKDLLTARVRAGATIILTTHILEVAERLADRIGIVAHGRLAVEGTLTELKTAAGRDALTLEDVFLQLTRPKSEPAPARVAEMAS
jgi:ABC-2 type transport system ATP-binding protein